MIRRGAVAPRWLWLAAGAPLLSGCAGALPLGHPAHVLPAGEVTASGGVAAQIAGGGAASAIRDARETTVVGTVSPADADARYKKGAATYAAVAPGLSPFVGARVGIAGGHEGGVSWTGRAVRMDARHAFTWDRLALSVGAGLHAARGRVGADADEPIRGLRTEGASAGGVDVPVLFGFRSAAGLVSAWTGARLGYERLGGTLCVRDAAGECPREDLRGTHATAAGMLGFQVGFRRVHVLFEAAFAYEHLDGRIGEASVKMSGFSIAPAAMLAGRFLPSNLACRATRVRLLG